MFHIWCPCVCCILFQEFIAWVATYFANSWRLARCSFSCFFPDLSFHVRFLGLQMGVGLIKLRLMMQSLPFELLLLRLGWNAFFICRALVWNWICFIRKFVCGSVCFPSRFECPIDFSWTHAPTWTQPLHFLITLRWGFVERGCKVSPRLLLVRWAWKHGLTFCVQCYLCLCNG